MFIDLHITKNHRRSQERNVLEGTCQIEFRSCERRRRYLLGPNYKHSTPNGVKTVLPLTGSIKILAGVRFQPKSC